MNCRRCTYLGAYEILNPNERTFFASFFVIPQCFDNLPLFSDRLVG